MNKHLNYFYKNKDNKEYLKAAFDVFKDCFDAPIDRCKILNLKKEDMALFIQVGHFLYGHAERFNELSNIINETGKPIGHLTIYRLFAYISAVEAIIGTSRPRISEKNKLIGSSQLLKIFLEKNLTTEEKNKIISKFEITYKGKRVTNKTFSHFSDWVIENRNGFLHRADLIYFADGPNAKYEQGWFFSSALSVRRVGGKSIGTVDVEVTLDEFIVLIKKAIIRYLTNKHKIPSQDLRTKFTNNHKRANKKYYKDLWVL